MHLLTLSLIQRIKSIFIRYSFFRFILVGLGGEVVYLFLYTLILLQGQPAKNAVFLAGLLGVLLNSFTHSKITFKVKYSRKIIVLYSLVQIICLISVTLLASILQYLAFHPFIIGIITMILWAVLSFFLIRNLLT
ncbi:GtrA family protein [Prochlorococcus sp. MIT 1341]|uniref:GtrA family protein n=1 Tax=Prochlorococcus sp. MIT 1341 TaxID=3096221 RepID=UPI0039BFB42A